MPATYAAVHKVLEKGPVLSGHLLDLGAGPGTASYAALDLFPSLSKITLIELSKEAIALGKTLSSDPRLNWVQQSLQQPIPSADVGILSYVINELDDPWTIVEKCWNAVSTLIIVEPGTPKAFQQIRKIRQQLIDIKAHIAAPCPHSLACPSDWCHFSARVERSRLHRQLKEGTLNYEDEKFCYLIASKTPVEQVQNRIVRHPLKQSGHVRLSVCASSGLLEEKIITRKDKELYRKARDAEWGDSM
jgi:ribosomal protein RSM22 (predicted rRNA methylase)